VKKGKFIFFTPDSVFAPESLRVNPQAKPRKDAEAP